MNSRMRSNSHQVSIPYFILAYLTLSWQVQAELAPEGATRQQSASPAIPTHRVGYRVLEIPSGGSKIPVALWYPTESKTKEITYGQSAARGALAPDASVTKGPWPLLIHSHGFGGGGLIHASQLEQLAARGYIVAAPDHGDEIKTVRIRDKGQGNVLDMLKHLREHPFTFEAYSYRPKELAAVLDGLLAMAQECQIDKAKITLLGHSMGGWTAAQVALVDKRVTALVLYSMGELNWLFTGQRFFNGESLKKLKMPVLFFFGEKEKKSNPRGVYARYCFEQVGGPAYLAMIPDGDHFVYCDRVFAPRSGATAAQKEKIVEVTASFLERHAKNRGIAVSADESRAVEATRPGPGEYPLGIPVGDLQRKFIVYVPPTYDGIKAVPVVIMFHGGGGTARTAMTETGWTRKADEAGFLAVFPEGTAPDPSEPGHFVGNPQTWNDGSGRFHAGEKNVDDVGFVNALIDDLIRRFKVNPHRIYAAGFSNGASLVYRIGAELSHRLAAIGAVASSGLRVEVSKLARPLPLIAIQGTADPRNPLEGGDVQGFGKSDKRPPVGQSVLKWAKLCGCPELPKTLLDEHGIQAIAYASAKGGAEVVFYTVEGMGHIWPGGESLLPETLVGKATDKLKANDVIWEFFSRHSLPGR